MLSIPVILGPTGVGKTALSLELAESLKGEIVSCDSRQVYKGMNIGTAKVTSTEMEQVPHHCVDIITPDIEYSAAQWARDANAAIEDMCRRGVQPVICGGTFFYYHALVEGFDHDTPPDKEFRQELLALEEQEKGTLHRELMKVNYHIAESLHPNDIYRIIRALQRIRDKGMVSTHENRNRELYRFIPVVLEREREALYDRINTRVDMMMEQGLFEEFQLLVSQGYGKDSPGMKSVGYQEFFNYIEENQSFNDAVSSIKQHSRKYAKKQLTWLRNRIAAALEVHAAEINMTDTVQQIGNLLNQ